MNCNFPYSIGFSQQGGWHHWSYRNVEGYVSRGSTTPSIVLTESQHEATKTVFRNWLFEKTGKRVGGKVDWTSISPEEMQNLTNRMFDAANVPDIARQEYFRALYIYIYGGT